MPSSRRKSGTDGVTATRLLTERFDGVRLTDLRVPVQALAVEAIRIMNERTITVLFVVEGQRPVFWQGPSLGFDVGGDGARTMMLVYDLPSSVRMIGTRWPSPSTSRPRDPSG